MQKKHQAAAVRYGSVAHHLKSPLAGMKSLVMIFARQLKKNNHTEYDAYLARIEEKIEVLNARVELVSEYVRFLGNDPQFVYSFFPLPDLLRTVIDRMYKNLPITLMEDKGIEILGDREAITFAFRGILFSHLQHTSRGVAISIERETRNVLVRFASELNKKSETVSSEASVEESLLLFIAANIARLHGGIFREKRSGRKRVIEFVVPKTAKKITP